MSLNGKSKKSVLLVIIRGEISNNSISFTANDIALLELAQDLDLTVYTPACLPGPGETASFVGKTAMATGMNSLLHSDWLRSINALV